ncbi:MAG: hypothetical protein IKA12_02610 [Clostridia bacterium]|nr:hypothetical protein [Clostridia bacterium]
MIQIVEVKTKKQIKDFATFPLKHYQDCPYYVPCLLSDEINIFNPKKNFRLDKNVLKGFLAYKDGVLVGRIAGLINTEHNKMTGENYIRFSRFDAIDDLEVFSALIKAVEDFGRSYGMKYIHGPWGFTDQDREGLLTYGFNERSTYSTEYSYEYYHKNLEKLGFCDQSKWVEYKFSIPDEPYDRITSIAQKLKERHNLTEVFDHYNLKTIVKKYGHKLFDLINEVYGDLDGYVPVEGKAVDNVLSQFATIVNTKYVSILVDENDEIMAFGVVLPSIADALIKNRGKLFPFGFIRLLKAIKRPKQLEMALIGVKKEHQNTGINSIVISRIMNNVVKDGIQLIESNPMLESNYNIQQQWKFAESTVHKKRQTYIKEIV